MFYKDGEKHVTVTEYQRKEYDRLHEFVHTHPQIAEQFRLWMAMKIIDGTYE